jgi:2-polyprenyl-3-methyl-5-hydroxy-6-metoxy-1,4-benzoquinol methylase
LQKNLGINCVECSEIGNFLQGKSQCYDIIFARDVIEHLKKEEIIAILKLIYDSLKPGGKFIIQTPNLESPFGCRYRYADFSHEVGFTRTSLNQVLRCCGFKKVDFYPTRPVPKGVKSAIRFILWKFIETLLRFYMLVETGTGDGIFTQNIISCAEK